MVQRRLASPGQPLQAESGIKITTGAQSKFELWQKGEFRVLAEVVLLTIRGHTRMKGGAKYEKLKGEGLANYKGLRSLTSVRYSNINKSVKYIMYIIYS